MKDVFVYQTPGREAGIIETLKERGALQNLMERRQGR